MYAIIETGGKQYKVAVGDTLKVEKLSAEAGSVVAFDKVLAFIDEKKSNVGSPYISGAIVNADVVSSGKGDKIIVHKQRPRRVYRKTNGHRQPYTTLKIKDMSAGGKDGA